MKRSHGAEAQRAMRYASGPFNRAAASSAICAMAMLRMFQRKPFALLPSEEVEAYQGTFQERQVVAEYNDRTLRGTASDGAAGLERLHGQTGVDEAMLVV